MREFWELYSRKKLIQEKLSGAIVSSGSRHGGWYCVEMKETGEQEPGRHLGSVTGQSIHPVKKGYKGLAKGKKKSNIKLDKRQDQLDSNDGRCGGTSVDASEQQEGCGF